MEQFTFRKLIDENLERRKAASFDLKSQIQACHRHGDQRRMDQITDQLMDMLSNTSNQLRIRHGGLAGLAQTAIALDSNVAPYMEKFLKHLLDCSMDPIDIIRTSSVECLYHIAQGSQGEILAHFNAIFEALSKLVTDIDQTVQDGAGVLNRQLQEIVTNYAPDYSRKVAEVCDERKETPGPLVDKAFSLARFIPLLQEHIYVKRSSSIYLCTWIAVLGSVTELKLIYHLPKFLDGLFEYLSDAAENVRITAENVLADLLRQIRDVQHQPGEQITSAMPAEAVRAVITEERPPDLTSERPISNNETDDCPRHGDESAIKDDLLLNGAERGTARIRARQGVSIDYPAIIEGLIGILAHGCGEIQQLTALTWLAEFSSFAKEMMVPCTPRLIPVILRNLVHNNPEIQSAAVRANELLFDIIQDLPFPREAPMASNAEPVPDRPSFGVPSHEHRQQPPATSPPATNPPGHRSTVDELLILFRTENKEVNVQGASKWLDMLKQKAPAEMLPITDSSFSASHLRTNSGRSGNVEWEETKTSDADRQLIEKSTGKPGGGIRPATDPDATAESSHGNTHDPAMHDSKRQWCCCTTQ